MYVRKILQNTQISFGIMKLNKKTQNYKKKIQIESNKF